MKQRVVTILKEHKGAISFFVVVLIVELLVMLTAAAIGAGQTAKVVFTASAGTLAMIGIDFAGEMVGMSLSETKRPAILAVITGAILALV